MNMSTTRTNAAIVLAAAIAAFALLAVAQTAAAQEPAPATPQLKEIVPLRERVKENVDAATLRRDGAREEAEERRTEARKEADERRAKAAEKREAVKTKALGARATTSDEKRAERAAELEEKARERAKAYAERALARLDAAIERMREIADRTESRVRKLEERGLDLSAAKDLIVKARTSLDGAKAAIEDTKQKTGETVSSGTPAKDALAAVRNLVKAASDSVKDAHGALVQAIREVQAGIRARTATTTPAASPAATE